MDYLERRRRIGHYFDRTAVQAWARLTSDAPVSGVRATVRAGRAKMRGMLVGWLGLDDRFADCSVLDAGCGTGLLAVDLARLGARVTAVDLSPNLVSLANDRLPQDIAFGRIDFRSGDMLDASLGEFDYLVAMDSLIHYAQEQVVSALAQWAPRIHWAMSFTFAPSSPLLKAMFYLGRLFPKSDRSPAIVPTAFQQLKNLIDAEPALAGWTITRRERVSKGFYTSEAIMLCSPSMAARINAADAMPKGPLSPPTPRLGSLS